MYPPDLPNGTYFALDMGTGYVSFIKDTEGRYVRLRDGTRADDLFDPAKYTQRVVLVISRKEALSIAFDRRHFHA